MNNQLVPKIRFKEFEGEWRTQKVQEFASLQNGFAFDSKDYTDIGVPVIRISNITNNGGIREENLKRVNLFNISKKFVLNEGDILVAMSGATTGKICIYDLKEKGYLNQRVGSYQVKKGYNKAFLYSLLTSTKFDRELIMVLVAGAQPNISSIDLLSFRFCLPTLPEQQKIAAFLGLLDRRLSASRRRVALLEEWKRGVMQNLLTRHLNTEIEWEFVPLKTIAKRSKTKNVDNELTLVLSNTATGGIVPQSEYFDRDIVNEKNANGYYKVRTDDFVYNPRISKNAPVGPVGRNKCADGIMSPLYTVFRFISGNVLFYEFYFQTTDWHRYMNNVANFGARHDRMNITNEDLMNLPVPNPPLEEQTRIAHILTTIDARVAAAKQEVSGWEGWKKGLLQGMLV